MLTRQQYVYLKQADFLHKRDRRQAITYALIILALFVAGAIVEKL